MIDTKFEAEKQRLTAKRKALKRQKAEHQAQIKMEEENSEARKDHIDKLRKIDAEFPATTFRLREMQRIEEEEKLARIWSRTGDTLDNRSALILARGQARIAVEELDRNLSERPNLPTKRQACLRALAQDAHRIFGSRLLRVRTGKRTVQALVVILQERDCGMLIVQTVERVTGNGRIQAAYDLLAMVTPHASARLLERRRDACLARAMQEFNGDTLDVLFTWTGIGTFRLGTKTGQFRGDRTESDEKNYCNIVMRTWLPNRLIPASEVLADGLLKEEESK